MSEEKQETFHKIMREWQWNRSQGHGRAGQDLFNAVQMHDEASAESMRIRPDIDPFYNDARIPAAISWLAERYFG